MLNAFIPMLKNVIIFIALAVPGYILVKSGTMKQEQSGVLSKLLMYVGMPFLILSGTLGVKFTGETVLNLVWAALIGTLLTFIFFFLSAFLVKDYKKKDSADPLWEKKVRGMERFCAIFSNNGFLGLPLAVAVFGGASKVFTFLVVVNIINNTLMYTVGVYMVSGDKKTIDLKKIFLNPVLIAFIIGIILNLVGVKKVLPEIVTFSDHFKNIVTPISMTILGMKMGGIKFSAMFGSWKMYYVSLIKLILVPVVSVVVTIALNKFCGLDGDMIMTMFIAFATPTAALAPAFADRYEGDVENGTIYTLGNTILSVITIPLLYLVICAIV
ncbi:MAG: AEC family transporter [Clostridia bacterium]|nr:AEC family transporter [Clostridia bacterium]